MAISKVLRLLASPKKLFAYLRLRADKSNRLQNLCRVTSLESAYRLREKIAEIDRKIAEL